MKPWVRIFLGVAGVKLREDGQDGLADLLSDAMEAESAGRDVDAIMNEAADRWQAGGPPSVDEIAARRKEIQRRIGDDPPTG